MEHAGAAAPGQNDLDEFYNLLDFCSPDCMGDRKTFERVVSKPVAKGRDLDATDREVEVSAARRLHALHDLACLRSAH